MGTRFSVTDLTCDGSHFVVCSRHGTLEGRGQIQMNEDQQTGTIVGVMQRGPERLVGRHVRITYQGESGMCELS